MKCDGFGSLAPQGFCRHVLRAIWGDRAEKFGQLSPIELGCSRRTFFSEPALRDWLPEAVLCGSRHFGASCHEEAVS